MRFKISLPFNRFARLLVSYSVRTGIIVLALIPVVGFLANGLTYVSGEGDVGEAFQSVGNAHALADASRDFRIAVAAMRIAARTLPPRRMLRLSTRSTSRRIAQTRASIRSKHRLAACAPTTSRRYVQSSMG
jgi:hypothetical protein